MYLSEPIGKNSLFDEINRLCNTTSEVYTNRAKIARINDALDKYWFLAVNSASKISLDDTTKTSLPVEAQNLVEGTNAYQLSDFTSNVLQIVRLAILRDNGNEKDLDREDFDDINEFYERYTTDSSSRGEPAFWTKMGDFIYLTPCPNYNETDGLRCYLNRELVKFTYTSFTTTHGTETINATAHGLSDNDAVILVTNGTIPTGYTADSQHYYVVNKATDTFQVSTVKGGSAAAITDDGTGNHSFLKVNVEPGIPVIHHNYLANYAAFNYMNNNHPKFQKLFQQIKEEEQAIMDYWRTMEGESNAIIKTKKRLYK